MLHEPRGLLATCNCRENLALYCQGMAGSRAEGAVARGSAADDQPSNWACGLKEFLVQFLDEPFYVAFGQVRIASHHL